MNPKTKKNLENVDNPKKKSEFKKEDDLINEDKLKIKTT